VPIIASMLACRCLELIVVLALLQVDSFSQPRYRGMIHCGRQIVRSEGAKGLWRGFGPALARSFPANAACFAVYEASRQMMVSALGL
jgi:solute carrier family 25 carnitine/acylcarnitine transporter 20/29